MTRSEEELRVDKAVRPTGRVRVRRYIVTEDVTVTLQLRREELAVEPIEGHGGADTPQTDAASGGDPGPLELVLHREEYEIVKRVVPVERVSITKQVVTEQREVAADLRKERIELDQDDPRRR